MYYDMDPTLQERENGLSVNTELLDNLLFEQGWSDAELTAYYALLGRLLNRLDKIQASLFLPGPPGSGKSSQFEMMGEFFPSECITSLGSETTFEFQNSYNKFLLLSPETPKKWKMDQRVIQSIISMNDRMKVGKKHGNAEDIKSWTCVSAWGGNNHTEDETGAFYRRWIIFRFDKVPEKVDLMLTDNLIKNVPTYILKFWAFYQSYI
jgi:hypothetical protein